MSVSKLSFRTRDVRLAREARRNCIAKRFRIGLGSRVDNGRRRPGASAQGERIGGESPFYTATSVPSGRRAQGAADTVARRGILAASSPDATLSPMPERRDPKAAIAAARTPLIPCNGRASVEAIHNIEERRRWRV